MILRIKIVVFVVVAAVVVEAVVFWGSVWLLAFASSCWVWRNDSLVGPVVEGARWAVTL
jgi:hypothetical protein